MPNSNQCSMQVAAKTARRFLSARAGVRVLLLHEGWPRTRYSARQQLSAHLAGRFRLPKSLAGVLVDPLFNSRLNPVVETCVDNYAACPDMQLELETFASRLENAVTGMLPEFAPIRCQPAYLYAGGPSIEEAVVNAMHEGFDTFVAVNLHLLSSRSFLRTILHTLEEGLSAKSSQPLKDSLSGQWMNVTTGRVAQSFNAILVANLECEEACIQFWAERLTWELRDEVNGVIFVLPSPPDGILGDENDYSEIAEEAARRIMYAMYARRECRRALPWRVAFHPTWSQPAIRLKWPKDDWSCTYPSIERQATDLRKRRPRESGDILVVPLSNLFDDFDTQTILPSLTNKMHGLKLMTASGLGAADKSPDFKSSCQKARLHCFTEVLKRRLLASQPRVE